MGTISNLGDQETLDLIISDNLEAFEDDSLTSIREYAMSDMTKLKHVKLPNLTRIARMCFGYTGLIDVSINDFPKVTYIEDTAFFNCESLQKVCFLSLNYVSSRSFSGCKSLHSVELYTNERFNWQNNSFENCYALDEVILHNSEGLNNNTIFDSAPIAMYYGCLYVPNSIVDALRANTNLMNHFHRIEAVEDYPVLPVGTISDSWDDIILSEENGSYLSKYSIGDYKFQKIGGVTCKCTIIGFDYDTLSNDSKKAHITWLVDTTFILTKTSFDWSTETLVHNKLNDLLTNSDTNFSEKIKTVVKKVSSDKSSNDRFFMFLEEEVKGDLAYDYFKSNTDNIIIKKSDGTAASRGWWLRDYTGSFSVKYIDGSGTKRTASINSNTFWLVYGFCT